MSELNNVATTNASHTVAPTDEAVIGKTATDVLLPAATGSGRTVWVYRLHDDVTIKPNGTDTIRGLPSLTLTLAHESLLLMDVETGLWGLLAGRYSQWLVGADI